MQHSSGKSQPKLLANVNQFASSQSFYSNTKSKSKSNLHSKTPKSAQKSRKNNASISSTIAMAAAQSKSSSKKDEDKVIIESHLNSPKAVDISFAHETNFPTSSTTNVNQGIEEIKNASLYDLIKLQMDQHVNTQKAGKYHHSRDMTPKKTSENEKGKRYQSKLQSEDILSEGDDQRLPSSRSRNWQAKVNKDWLTPRGTNKPQQFMRSALRSVMDSKKNATTVVGKNRREMRVDLTSAIRVDLKDEFGPHSQPGSTNVTPGRKSSLGRSKKSYSSRSSAQNHSKQGASKGFAMTDKIEKMYQGSSNLHVIHQTSPKKAHQQHVASVLARPKKVQQILTAQQKYATKSSEHFGSSIGLRKPVRDSARAGHSPFPLSNLTSAYSSKNTEKTEKSVLQKNEMTASKAKIITQLAKRKTSVQNSQMNATVAIQKPLERFSYPQIKQKKKKKQSAAKADAGTHGTMPSTSQNSTSHADITSPPFSVHNGKEAQEFKRNEALSDNSKSTPYETSMGNYGSRPSASEKKPPVQPIAIPNATGTTDFGRDQNPQTPTTPQRVGRAERSRSKSERLTAKKNQKQGKQDADSQAFLNEKACLSDNSPETEALKSDITAPEETHEEEEQAKRITLQQHSDLLHKRLEALKNGTQRPEFTIPSTEMSVAQVILERLKQNMMISAEGATKTNKFKESITDRSCEVVKIGAFVKQASTSCEGESNAVSNRWDKTMDETNLTDNMQARTSQDDYTKQSLTTPARTDEQSKQSELILTKTPTAEQTLQEASKSNVQPGQICKAASSVASGEATPPRKSEVTRKSTPLKPTISPAMLESIEIQQQTLLTLQQRSSIETIQQDCEKKGFLDDKALTESMSQPERAVAENQKTIEGSDQPRMQTPAQTLEIDNGTPEAEPPLILTPTRPQDCPKMTDEDFELFNERHETRVDMFEEDLLDVIDEVKPQAPAQTEEKKKPLKPTTNFVPSPMKPQPKSNQKGPRGFSRKSIKMILSSITAATFQDILRIKKPMRPALLIGQLFCMLLWISKESTLPSASANNVAEELPRVPFQNLEDEFEVWENVQSYLKQDISSLHAETQNIITKLPLPPVFVEQYLKKMQHKVVLNERVLSRNHSVSLDKIMSLVRSVLDWHLNSQSSLELPTLLSPIALKRDASNGGFGQRRSVQQQRADSAGKQRPFGRKGSLSRLMTGRKSAQPRKDNKEAESENLSKFAQDTKKSLKNKYQQYKPLLKKTNDQQEQVQPKSVAQQHSFKIMSDGLTSPREATNSKCQQYKLQGQALSNPQFIRSPNPISASPRSVQKGVAVPYSLYGSTLASRAKSITPLQKHQQQKMTAQRPTVSSNTGNALTIMKANSEIVVPRQEFRGNAINKSKALMKSTTTPEENLDPELNNCNDELINLVVNSGSPPNTSQLASYNSYCAVITPFNGETTSSAIAEVTEDPSTAQTAPNSSRRGQSALGSQRPTRLITEVVEETTHHNITHAAPINTESSENQSQLQYQPIKVYAKESENSSDRSFKLEATNIGEYYAKQNELHTQLQQMLFERNQNRNITASLTQLIPPTQEECHARTTQTLQELREKHLLRMKQPASPTSIQSLKNEQNVNTDENRVEPTLKFDEWRKNQIDKIVATLEDEEGENTNLEDTA